MQKRLDRCSEAHRDEALSELRAELADFSHDGLVQLLEDLTTGSVVRGSWTGCVISYKRGGAGSARRDRFGRARNAFTVLWDSGWVTDEEVLDGVRFELRRRAVKAPETVSAAVEKLDSANRPISLPSPAATVDKTDGLHRPISLPSPAATVDQAA